jgi:uncharacterized protein (TIGR00369 family)
MSARRGAGRPLVDYAADAAGWRPANRCFVCGPENPVGLRLQFRQTEDGAEAEFVPAEHHVGWEGMIHGGILAAVLDDAMGNALFLRGETGVTIQMEVRFRQPVRPGDRLLARARIRAEDRRLATIDADLVRDGETVCAGVGTFLRKPLRGAPDPGAGAGGA